MNPYSMPCVRGLFLAAVVSFQPAVIDAADFSGTVTSAGTNEKVSGVSIRVHGTSRGLHSNATDPVNTGTNGNWLSGSWTRAYDILVVPSQGEYTFSPASRSFSFSTAGSSRSRLDFTRHPFIRGTVSCGSKNLQGVRINRSSAGGQGNSSSDSSGNYFLRGLTAENYTLDAVDPNDSSVAFHHAGGGVVAVGKDRVNNQDFVRMRPIATTGLPGEVEFGRSRLGGTVDGDTDRGLPGVAAAVAWIEYGIRGAPEALGERSDELAGLAPTADAPVTPSVFLEGLVAGETYDYRLVAAYVDDQGVEIVNSRDYGETLSFIVPYPAAGSAIRFDGFGDHVEVVDPSFEVSTSLTVEAWIFPTGPGDVRNGQRSTIVGREGEYLLSRDPVSGVIAYALAVNESSDPPPDDSPGWAYVDTEAVAPLDQWTHVALTYDSSLTNNPRVRVYVNGEHVHSGNADGEIVDVLPAKNQLWIGGRSATTAYFEGLIDEVRVWRTARSSGDIARDFRRSLAGSEVDLAASFDFNEGSGSEAINRVPGSGAGKLENDSVFTTSGAPLSNPIIITQPAISIGSTTAALQASVNPSGHPTEVFFQFGATVLYGNNQVGPSDLQGSDLIAATVEVENLQPGTTYHYRAVAQNSLGGLAYGEDRTFTTLVEGVGWPTSTQVTGGSSEGPRHCVDDMGNLYVAGQFSGSLPFGSLLQSLDEVPDAFVGMMSVGGDWLWGNQIVADTGSSVTIEEVGIDASGHVIVVGYFDGSIWLPPLDSSDPGETLVSVGESDVFVAKVSQEDGWLWAKSFGSTEFDQANALAVDDSNGKIFVGGAVGGSVTVGGIDTIGTGGVTGAFVAQLDSDGDWLWATSIGSAANMASVKALALGPDGNAMLAGDFTGSLEIPIGESTSTLSSESNSSDAFIAQVAASGEWLNALRAGGSGEDFGHDLTIDSGGNAYLLGKLGGSATFGSGTTSYNATGEARLFVAKLDKALKLIWFAEGGEDLAGGITTGAGDGVYVTGSFNGLSSFPNPPGQPVDLFSAGGSDVFLARLDRVSGMWEWVRQIGSGGSETHGQVTIDGNHKLVVSGTFQNTLQVGHASLSTASEHEVFLARYNAEGTAEHNTFVIGEAIPIPMSAQLDGGAFRAPQITILEREHADSTEQNSFVWSLAERKLYPVRPVTATIKWPLNDDPTDFVNVVTMVGNCVWPSADPPSGGYRRHVVGVPVEVEPDGDQSEYRFLNSSFSTAGGSVDPNTRHFSAASSGWSVLQFLLTDGAPPNPEIHPSQFEVVQSVLWDSPEAGLVVRNPDIGRPLNSAEFGHSDPNGKNGYVLFEQASYDGVGEDAAHDRASRTGPIIPVNLKTADSDDLVVVWFTASTPTGISWPSKPVRYLPQWPADPLPLVLASGDGARLNPSEYPSKLVYRQSDPSLPGFNPNEEHAALYGDVLYALRNDLNEVVSPKASEPYTLLKYRDPLTDEWRMNVYQVVATDEEHAFDYEATAGSPLNPPAPLSLLPACGEEDTWDLGGPGFKDHQGRLYAKAAGQLTARFWYRLQPGFFFDLDRDGSVDATADGCVPWLAYRSAGNGEQPVALRYTANWPAEVPTLEIGETVINAKFGLPDVTRFAHAQVIHDDGDPDGNDPAFALVQLLDPASPRIVQLRPPGASDFQSGPGYAVFETEDPDGLFEGIATRNDAGMLEFVDLPYTLRARLRYDPLNHDLHFSGLIDESLEFGGETNPLVLPNILSPRDIERVLLLNPGVEDFENLITTLYNLTRNPNRLDRNDDDQPDTDLLVGLASDGEGRFGGQELGDIPKALSAGRATDEGYVTISENNHPALGGLPVVLHVVRVEGGPYRGHINVVPSDNVFDEKLNLRHNADFGGAPQNFDFEWYYRPSGDDPEDPDDPFPETNAQGGITNARGWVQFFPASAGTAGLNEITIGDGGASGLLVLANHDYICRFRRIQAGAQADWSAWVGNTEGSDGRLAEGWVSRVQDGLNRFEARSEAFHEDETVTFASMLQQAGTRFEGSITFNPDGDSINQVGLIEAYETVLERARELSIDASPRVNDPGANAALIRAAGFIADLYFLLGNEATADAADPTIGFRTSSAGYGTLAPSIFAFQDQLDSLLEEELVLLRGRDDTAATVRRAPVYNRAFWNFTRDDGEVAYAQAYNITDQNDDGFINEDDASVMFPQAHGDAWGHYLSATKTYYDLLRNDYFDWVARGEEILLAGEEVTVNYRDERKFARAAAAKAKVGAEVADLTYRLHYVDDPNGQYQGYKDTDPERAWGVAEWAERAGSGALFDWAVANAVIPAVDPDYDEATDPRLAKVDRTTIPELGEIASHFSEMQRMIDKADIGLNPLGLAKNSVPFDIDPSQVADNKTHFEQIYERAVEALNNTVAVFDHANQLSQGLRAQQDDVNEFSDKVDEQERDYKHRMIEIFGYPYAGDIGPGRTYPSGYDGADIYHYMYANTVELDGETSVQGESFSGFFTSLREEFDLKGGTNVKPRDFFFPDDLSLDADGPLADNVLPVDFPISTSDYGFTAPPAWGQRRAPGEIQTALGEMVQNSARYKQALLNYNNLILEIEDSIDLLQARYNLEGDKVRIRRKRGGALATLTGVVVAAKATANSFATATDFLKGAADTTKDGLPKVVGTATDTFFPARLAIGLTKGLSTSSLVYGENLSNNIAEGANNAKETVKDVASVSIEKAEFEYEVQQKLAEIEELFRQEALLQAELFIQREVLTQSLGTYQAAVARGLRLADERIAFRRKAAAETQQSRYQDMTFRIFRNDAIQKYRAQFDLAARYVYMAAVAYDYETQLLGDATGSGRDFLTDIVRQRALGEVVNGTPIAGRHGLADPLARLNQNFAVLKGQLGFNNPQTETGRFSLRHGLFRLRESSDEAWREELKKHVVPNLWDLPEFRRYCRPFAPESAGVQPGLVLRFPSSVTFGLNYFGWPLGGGDSSYDSTLFATKVRSAGVWFSNYDGNGLSVTPRVYLVPAGADIMRSPSGNDLETREWRVVDQKVPVPFPIGYSSLNDPSWIPANDSLSDTMGEIRRFSSFRAYHDSGVFEESQTASDSRLIGRSVWNSDWMLVIPGGTFLFDSDEGLDRFIDTVSDIKIFFQTYAYSGN